MAKKSVPKNLKKTSPKLSPNVTPKTSPNVTTKTSPNVTTKTSPNVTTKTSPLGSISSPVKTGKSSPEKSKVSEEQKMANFDKRQSDAPMPSFYMENKEDSPKDVSEYKIEDIVTSQKDREDSYDYLKPKKTEKFTCHLISNIVLTVIVLTAIIVEIVLVKQFLYDYKDEMSIPDSNTLQRIVVKACSDISDLPKYKRMCSYVRDKYTSSCKLSYCANVILTSDTTEGPLFSDENVTVKLYTFRPLFEEYHEMASPEFTPCFSGAWCKNRVCEIPGNESRQALQEFDKLQPVDGGWKLFCLGADVPCFEKDSTIDKWNNSKYFMSRLKCFFGDCNTSGPFIPTHFVEIGMRACVNPLPRNGGKSCWRDKANANDAIVVTKICGTCDNATQVPPSECTPSSEAGKECTVTCNNQMYYLPNSYNCTRHDKKHGFCYNGICAEYVPDMPCYQ